MKIAIVQGVFFPYPGGAQVQFHNICNKLIENKVKVDCFIFRKTNISNNKYNIFQINYFITSVVYFFLYYFNLNLSFLIKFWLIKIVKKKYDLWHFNFITFKSLILINCLKELNQNVIVTFQGIDLQIYPKIKYGYRLNKKYNKYLLSTIHKIDRFTAISKNIERDLIKIGIKKDKISNIPNSVYLKKFNNYKKKKNVSKKLKLITVGRFAELKKGFDLIEKILIGLKKKKIDFIWKIIGKNSHKILKYKQIKNNLDKFKIINNIENKKEIYFPNSRLIKHYKSSDLYINLSRIESFGITFIESLASKVPIISFDTKGINELIKMNRNGILIRKFHLNELIKKIYKLSKNKKILDKLKNRSSAGMHKFDLDENVKSLVKLYKII